MQVFINKIFIVLVNWQWQIDSEFGGCISLNFIHESFHLDRIQFRSTSNNRNNISIHTYLPWKKLPAIVIMYIQLIRACLPLNTGKPQPHERVLRQGTWFYLSLDAYSVSSIFERGTEVVKRLIHCDYPILFC